MVLRSVISQTGLSARDRPADTDVSMPARLPVTVAIPARNEERNLPACLARLQRFERVVVIDSASTDRTRAIALDHGAEVIDFAWEIGRAHV